jgi:mannose-6-phosphate isomerase-like protein (cupin superfamily)
MPRKGFYNTIENKDLEDFGMDSKAFTIDLNQTQEYQPLLRGAPQTCGMRSGRVYLLPGQECGQHSTNAHEEQLVFLAGQGTSYLGQDQSQAISVGYGKILYVPPHTLHNIKNTGTEPLVYIYCVTPILQTMI